MIFLKIELSSTKKKSFGCAKTISELSQRTEEDVGNYKRVTDKLASSSDWHMLVLPILTEDHL